MPPPDEKSREPVIEAVGVRAHATQAEVNWQISAGEFWVVGGPHGSGKSSVLAAVAGMRPPATGTVRHFGRELGEISAEESVALRTRVGFVFKDGGRMFAEMTVEENIAFPLRYHRNWTAEEANDTTLSLMDTTGLSFLAGRDAQTLSQAWRQRVALARALAMMPEVMFLDEPLAGLDILHRAWWRGFLAQLSRGAPFTNGRGTTLIIATSDFSLWDGLDGHFARLKDGAFESLGHLANIPENH